MQTLKKIIISAIVMILALGVLSACANLDSGAPTTNRQEEKIDEGDIIKVADDGTLFSFQSDGIIAARSTEGAPYVVDYDFVGYEYCIPLEMYVNGSRLTVIRGNRSDFYTGDYSAYRAADYDSFSVIVYDISYLTENKEFNGEMKNHIIYTFNTEARLKESRVFNSDLYLCCEYENVSSPDVDADGNINYLSKRKRNELTVDDTPLVEVYGIRYMNNGHMQYIRDKALYIEPTEETSNSRTVTGLYKLSNINNTDSGPYVASHALVYGSELNTVYMSENYVYPIFSAYTRAYGCNRPRECIMLTKFDGDLNLRAKRLIKYARIPSRYAFKEINGTLFGTVEKSYVELHSFNANLGTISSVNLCYGEDLHAVTYSTDGNGNDYCLAVTYRNTDPLYRVNISDPQNLTVESELTITGYSVYLHKYPPLYTVGIGYETTSSGTVQGAKVTLFDTSKTETEVINSLLIPDYDYAEVFNDPRAFITSDTHIVFGFAMSRRIYLNGVYTYKQGFYLFGVKQGTLVDIAYLTNFENGIVGQERNFYDYNTYRKLIRRAIITDNYIYTVADGLIVSYNFEQLNAGNKTPEHTLLTTMTALTGNTQITNPSEKQDGIFFEG